VRAEASHRHGAGVGQGEDRRSSGCRQIGDLQLLASHLGVLRNEDVPVECASCRERHGDHRLDVLFGECADRGDEIRSASLGTRPPRPPVPPTPRLAKTRGHWLALSVLCNEFHEEENPSAPAESASRSSAHMSAMPWGPGSGSVCRSPSAARRIAECRPSRRSFSAGRAASTASRYSANERHFHEAPTSRAEAGMASTSASMRRM